MKKIIWNRDQFSIGDDALNRQNQRVADIINLCMHNPDLLLNVEFRASLIAELMEYSEGYLAYKENILKDIGCIGLEKHALYHWKYLEELSQLVTSIENDEKQFSVEFMEFITQWWNRQIVLEDKKCRECFETGKKVRDDEACMSTQNQDGFSHHISVEHSIFQSLMDKVKK
ncbi:hypothetical protein MTBPR1_90139 [Candidatus Terasakiella magnetica]|uniref:Hemerythrin-like domain-containing protein n=1 Tax=Candidatus Terasakiella magnetica TaxID=1867952 RepID=A0A1C3RLX4_9PROT|nr:hypothetical protein [Candidatus Terasakiella magnetica]SCA58292.1 hypothetical protein MTBPR1_90139 [Candidatus Terasakiella magnetica]